MREDIVLADDFIRLFPDADKRIYALIAGRDGIKAKEIAAQLDLNRKEVNRILTVSALMREMCYQDDAYQWHALIRDNYPHDGLFEFSGWYGTVSEFMKQDETSWLSQLMEGCLRIGRNLNDTRGLIHSFLDCRHTMRALFNDLSAMMSQSPECWEIVFEFRFNRARYIRIYADVLVITPSHVFSLEFKMKNRIDAEEFLQAAKYTPYLEVIFGMRQDIVPALVLTGASDLFDFVRVGHSDSVLPVCSGDMLFNVFNEYIGFLH